MGPKILRTWSRKLVNQLSQLSFLWPFSSRLNFLAPSVLLGIPSSSEIQKELLLVFKSFYAPQVKEDNPMAWNVSSKLLCALSLRNVCLYLFEQRRSISKITFFLQEICWKKSLPRFRRKPSSYTLEHTILRHDSVSRPIKAFVNTGVWPSMPCFHATRPRSSETAAILE